MALPASVPATIYWTGRSGKSYPTHLAPIGIRYRSVGGIYIACHQLPNGNWLADYIGEAQDLDDRVGSGLRNHHKLSRFLRAGATHLCTMIVPGGVLSRLAVEKDLCASCSPSCNG
jgi:hypothetical protein